MKCLSPVTMPMALLFASCGLFARCHAQTWTTAAPMPTARLNLAAVTGTNGTIYAIGGENWNGFTRVPFSNLEAYNPATNTWTILAPMPFARYNLTAATGSNGIIYVFGGWNGGPLRTVEAYNPTTNTWVEKAPMPTARHAFSTVTGNDGKIYTFGGSTDGGGTSSAVVEAYDPTTNSWSAKASMPEPRFGMAAAKGNDGRIYIIDGLTQPGFIFRNIVRVYDPLTNSWSNRANDPIMRDGASGAIGSDGRIYVMGGGNLSGFFNTVEAYDPLTDSWASTVAMPATRSNLAATTGLDGRIYAIGGYNTAPDQGLNTVEVFTPGSAALSLSNITATGTSPTSALVSWTTSVPASSVVEFGKTASYGYVAQDTNRVTNHSLGLGNLLPNALYHYRVKSTDANGKTVTSGDGTFVTGQAHTVEIIVRYSNVRRLNDGTYAVDVTVRNIGGGIPSFVNLDSADLRVSPLPSLVTYPLSPKLPMGLGPLNGPAVATITLYFPASAGSPGARRLLEVGGSFNDPANNLFFTSYYSYSSYITLP